MAKQQNQAQILDLNKFRQNRAIEMKMESYVGPVARIDSMLRDMEQQIRFDRLNKAKSNDVVNSAVATELARQLDYLMSKIMDIQEDLQVESCVAEVVDMASARKARESKKTAA